MNYMDERAQVVEVGRRGFTLVELMITLAIVGIVTAMASVGYIDQIPKMRANTAARQIWSDLHRARSNAAKTGMDTVVLFYPNLNTYSIVQDNPGDPASSVNWLRETGTPNVTLNDPNRDIFLAKNVKLPEGIIFAHGSGLPRGADVEMVGTGVTLKYNRVFFQPTGHATINNGDSADTLLEGKIYRAIYIIPEQSITKKDFKAFYGVLIDSISGLPRVCQYNPDGKDWGECTEK